MIILDATDQSITVTLGGIPSNQFDWTASYIDVTTTTYTPGSSQGFTSSGTPVTMVSAPASSTQRQIKLITVNNKSSSAVVVHIEKVIAGTARTLCRILLSTSDTLQYTDGEGFVVMDDNGLEITSGNTLGISAGTQSASGVHTVVFSDSNGVSFGLNSQNKLTISTSCVSVKYLETPHAELAGYTVVSTAISQNNIYFQRIFIPYCMTVTRVDILASISVANSTAGSAYQSLGLYARNASFISVLSSDSSKTEWTANGATSDSNGYVGVSGLRPRNIFPQSWAVTPGEYYIGWGFQGSNVAGSSFTFSVYGQNTLGALQGANSVINLSNNNIWQEADMWGEYGAYNNIAGTGELPSIVYHGDILWGHSGGNASAILRQPYVRFYG